MSNRSAHEIRWTHRLGVRLGLAMALVSCLSFGAVTWLLIDHEKDTLTLELTRRVLSENRNLSLAMGGQLLRKDPELGLHPLVISAYKSLPELQELVVLDSEGVIVGHRDLLRVGERIEVLPGDPIHGLNSQENEQAWIEGESIVVTRPILQHGALVGSLVARVDLGRISAAVRESVRRALSIAAAGFLAVLLLILTLVARALRPLGALREAVLRIGDGDLSTRIDVSANDELGLFADLVNEMTSGLERAQSERIIKERLDHELVIARDLQATLLPHSLEAPQGYQLAAQYTPALEVGGDYYDVIPLENGYLGLVVADVSGKGVPGLVVMAMLRVVLRSLASAQKTPAEVLIAVDRMLSGSMRKGMFVTVIYGVLDPFHNRFRYSSAGHCPPLSYGPGGAQWLPAGGKPLGLFPSDVFASAVASHEVGLAESDCMLLYSDGLVEAMDLKDGQLGQTAVFRLAENQLDRAPREFLDALCRQVEVHRGGRGATDDLTLLAVGRESRVVDAERLVTQ